MIDQTFIAVAHILLTLCVLVPCVLGMLSAGAPILIDVPEDNPPWTPFDYVTCETRTPWSLGSIGYAVAALTLSE